MILITFVTKIHRKRHISRVLVFLKGTTKRETDGQTLSDDIKVDINTRKRKKSQYRKRKIE